MKIEKTDGLTVRFLVICLDHTFPFFKFPDTCPVDDLLVDGAVLVVCRIPEFGEKTFI